MTAPADPQNHPAAPAEPENYVPWIILAGAFFVLYFGIASMIGDPPPPPDPCSDEVLDAPYETGSEYWDRDQAGERTQACIFDRLDSFGE